MFDEVVMLLADRPSTRFLADKVADEVPSTLRTATILAAPAAMTALNDAIGDLSRSNICLLYTSPSPRDS